MEEKASKDLDDKAKALHLNKGLDPNLPDDESEEIKTEIELSSERSSSSSEDSAEKKDQSRRGSNNS